MKATIFFLSLAMICGVAGASDIESQIQVITQEIVDIEEFIDYSPPTAKTSSVQQTEVAPPSGGNNDGDLRTTHTGIVYTRDRTHPNLGEAWRDPNGVIWGDTAKSDSDRFLRLEQREAMNYCYERGAELPTKEDFFQFAVMMGGKPVQDPDFGRINFEGYSFPVLPNFVFFDLIGERHQVNLLGPRLGWTTPASIGPST